MFEEFPPISQSLSGNKTWRRRRRRKRRRRRWRRWQHRYCIVVGELSSFMLQVHNFLNSSMCINVLYVFCVFGVGFCKESTNVIVYSTSVLLSAKNDYLLILGGLCVDWWQVITWCWIRFGMLRAKTVYIAISTLCSLCFYIQV
jgi:hypothetical protein